MIGFFPFETVDLPLFNQMAILLINSVGIALIVTVVNHNKFKDILTKIFIAMGILMFTWIDFAYLARLVGENNLYWSEIFLRIAWIATPMFFSMVYLITIYILRRQNQFKLLNRTIIIAGIFMSIITGFSDFIVEGVKFSGQNLDIIYGKGFLPFLGIIILFMIATLVPLFRFRSNDENKTRVRVFLTGILIFYGANAIFNIGLPFFFNTTHLYFFGDYSLIFIVGFTSYSILRYQLLNIRVISTELFLIALWLFILMRTLFSETREEQIINIGLLTSTFVLGIFLMRAVLNEVKQRELLAIANDKLEKLNMEKSEFLSIASHQLKSPLTVVKGYASMLMEGSYGSLGDKGKEVANRILNSAQDLVVIIDDFLNVSRIEQGRMKYDFGPVDIREMSSEIVEDLKKRAKEKGLSLSLDSSEEENFNITADIGKIRQVVTNLVDNSIKYTKEGSVKITLLRNENKKTIKITVDDTGIGMSQATLGVLFERFNRAKDIGKEQISGSGLGLYVAKEIVKAHNGKIWAESDGEQKGSRFIVELPIEKKIDNDIHQINKDNSNMKENANT